MNSQKKLLIQAAQPFVKNTKSSGFGLGLPIVQKLFKVFPISVGPEYYFARNMKTYAEHGNSFGEVTKQEATIGGSLTFEYISMYLKPCHNCNKVDA